MKSKKTSSKDVLTILEELIRIESVNPQFGGSGEAQMADYIEKFFSGMASSIVRQEVFPKRENVICHFPSKKSPRTLIFEAHMDTVSFTPSAKSQLEPFREGSRLYGRGACDTKGSMAAMLWAISSIIEENGEPPISIYFIAAVDEEYRAKGVYDLIEKGIQADGAVIGEPTNLDIIIAHKGVYRFTLESLGKSVHSSKPQEGINAIYKMFDVVRAMRNTLEPQYEQKIHPLTGPPTLNVGIITGGNEVNTVPASCQIEVDRRVVPGEKKEEVVKEFDDLLNEISQQDPDFQGRIFNTFYDPPLNTEAEAAIVRSMQKACTSNNVQPSIVGVPYGSDASKIALLGIPSVVFGPGSIINAHTENEYVEVEEVISVSQIFKDLIFNF